jgi:hypothetical protein
MPRVTDDSGRQFPLLSSSELARTARREKHEGLSETAHRLRRTLRTECRRITPDRLGVGIAVTAVGAFVWLLGVMAFAAVGSAALGIPGALIWLIALVALAARVLDGYTRGTAAQNFAATAVAEGACGSCGFSLEGAAPTPAGLVTCPECGAAWKFERMTRPRWTAPVMLPHPRRWWYRFVPGVRSELELWAPDARGCYVPLYDTRLLTLESSVRAAIPRAALIDLRRRLRRRTLWLRWLASSPLLMLAAYLLSQAVAFTRDDNIAGAWSVGAIAGVLGLLAIRVAASSAFTGPRGTAVEFVRAGLCPACAAPLPEFPAWHPPPPPAPQDSVELKQPTPADATRSAPPPPTPTANVAMCTRCRAAWTRPAC